MTEQWKDIKGFEGLYQVSDLGNVKSLDCVRIMKNGVERTYYGKTLSSYLSKDDYYVVDLTSKNGIRKSYKIHRLVAETFVKNPLNLPIINHRNENKHDNKASNLEWCTVKYNLRYGTTQKRRAEKIGWRIRQFDKDGKYIRTFSTLSKASKVLNFPKSGIYKSIISGEIYKNFFFRKIDEEKR